MSWDEYKEKNREIFEAYNKSQKSEPELEGVEDIQNIEDLHDASAGRLAETGRGPEATRNDNDRSIAYGYNPSMGVTGSGAIVPIETSSMPDMQPQYSRKRNRKKPSGYVTKKAFILGLILSMLATSGLTILGLALAGVFNPTILGRETHTISATNYTLSDSTDANKSIEEIVALNENAVVEIQTETVVSDYWLRDYVSPGAGSGVIIDSTGYILTCQHVIDGANTITVITKDGTKHKAKVIGQDQTTDIAVIKIPGNGFSSVTYGNSDTLSVGDLAVAIGNPLGRLGGTASVGIISALDREITVEGQLMNLLQTDASINPGNSGGGLFDGNGNLIGIVEAKSMGSNVEGLGFAIPINDAAAIAKELIETGKISGRPLIGVSVIDASDPVTANQFDIETPGLYIYEVFSQEATDAGLQEGDRIDALNGVVLNNRNELTTELKKYSPGDKITLTITREGETLEIDTILTEAE